MVIALHNANLEKLVELKTFSLMGSAIHLTFNQESVEKNFSVLILGSNVNCDNLPNAYKKLSNSLNIKLPFCKNI